MILKLKKQKPHKTREGKIGLTIAAHNIDVAIDIGANLGQTYDELRAGGFKGRIISVEPLPSLQAGLQAKAKKDPLWTVLPPLALGDKNGECDINVSEAHDMSSVLTATAPLHAALPRTRAVETVTVPMKTLDTFYNELDLADKNVYLKMDTQGFEMNILRGGARTMAQIKGIQLEMSLFELYEGETLYDELIIFLKEHGFKPHIMVERYFSRKLNRQLQIDAVFYRD